jgi:hydrogenase maturation protein HypF
MDRGKSESITTKIIIKGKVQGVGFRPFLARLAKNYDIVGLVFNAGGIVEMVITTDEAKTKSFIDAIKSEKPPISKITAIETERVEARQFTSFKIIESKVKESQSIFISADLPICEDCKNELFDPNNVRYLHPFISCSACGPRYSIIKTIPYDRENTTMDEFPLCPSCKAEYSDIPDRRFHAQTISCHNCGPYLIYQGKYGSFERQQAFEMAVKILLQGGIVAIKGIGGYHLAASPFYDDTVKKLRGLKGREQKPFAVMFFDIENIKQYANVSKEDEELLSSSARPIVLLTSLPSEFSSEVSKGSLQTGAFLPYTPLQYLLIKACGHLIMTSANLQDMPIIKDDREMLAFNGEYLDGVLYNHRKIVTALDDSVIKVFDGSSQMIRRSRGYVPEPIIPQDETNPQNLVIFAAGGDLKSTFCLANDDSYFLSQPFGDLEEWTVFEEYKENLERMKKLFKINPQVVAFDLHPNYFSSKYTKSLGMQATPVQHHHAHIASVMAENHIKTPIIGVAFDGTGYGDDGKLWGGEFLVCEGGNYIRRGHLQYVKLLGGDSSAKDAKKTAVSHCIAAGLSLENNDYINTIVAAIKTNVNTTLSSSMGRLFDAVASILNIKQENSFEGECAITLENQAQLAINQNIDSYPMSFEVLDDEGILILNHFPVISEIFKGVKDGEDIRALALGFHIALAEGTLSICKTIQSRDIINQVALSGGVFQNNILLSRTMNLLKENGFDVYINKQVPTNDGGIALGQAYLARLRQGEFLL